eukprot:s1595_g4.t1
MKARPPEEEEPQEEAQQKAARLEDSPKRRERVMKDPPKNDKKERRESDSGQDRRQREAKSGGVRGALVKAAARAEAERDPDRHRRKRKRRGRSRSRGRRRRSRSRRRRSGSSRSPSSSTDSSSLVPPLQKKANRNPGSVLKMLTSNVAEALASAAVTDPEQPTALGSQANLLSSYYQIVARPQLSNKVRDCRELETLARCVDFLRHGRLPELGDALAGRFMAVESAGLTNNWTDAQHLEVIPVRHAGLAPPAIMLQAQRHTRQVEKASGRKSWNRPGGAPWGGKGDSKTDHQGGKGDGRPKGKGPRKGGGKAGKAAWKDRDKAETAPEGAAK